MNQKIKYLSATLFLIVLKGHVCTAQKQINVVDLRCQNMVNPEGVIAPLFSWKTYSEFGGFVQKSYEVQIATTIDLLEKGKSDIWISGKQTSSEQINIVPSISSLSDGTRYWWRVRVWNAADSMSAWSSLSYFSIGLLSEQSWTAKWITRNWENGYTFPFFRKVIDPKTINGAKPTRAIIYLCGLGCSDFLVNGQAVYPLRMLDPAQTKYEQYELYSTFDVTQFIQKGENCIGIMHGKGWFTQDATCDPSFSYGMPMLRLQMNVTYSDGSSRVFGSDESWKWKNGPVVKCNTHKGELYDANREIDGRATVSVNDSGWDNSIVATQNVPPVLRPQMIDPILKKEILRNTKMWQDTAGRWIFDFVENITGLVQLELKQPKGTHLTIRTFEEVCLNGNLDFIYTGERFVRIQTDEYICKGVGKEDWSPRFTYHGFCYAELSGMVSKPESPCLSAIKVRTDVSVNGSFECSDNQINHLHQLAIQSFK
jgi:alpha-L-rhamnosidase